MKETTTNFNFGLIETTETQHSKKLGDREVWKRSFKNSKGEMTELVITDKALVISASNIDKLLAMKEFTSLGVCAELSQLAENKEKIGFRSVAEIGEKLFNLKPSTATQYARVGKYFVITNDTDKGRAYRLIEDVAGATVTNLVQCLSLIDDKADDPTELFFKAIADDKLHVGGTLASVKKEVKSIKNGGEDGDVIADVEPKEVSSEKATTDTASAFNTILARVEELSDTETKAKAIELVQALQELLAK